MTLEIYCWRMPPCISFRCPQPRGPRHRHLHLCGGAQWPHRHRIGKGGMHAYWPPHVREGDACMLAIPRAPGNHSASPRHAACFLFPLTDEALPLWGAFMHAPCSTRHAYRTPLGRSPPSLQVALCFGSGAAKVLFGQEPDVASLVGQYCWGLLPGMWPLVLGLVLMKYLQTQVRP